MAISTDVIDGLVGDGSGGGADNGGDDDTDGGDGGDGGGVGSVGAGAVSASSTRPQHIDGNPKKTTRKTIATIVAAAPMVPIRRPVVTLA